MLWLTRPNVQGPFRSENDPLALTQVVPPSVVSRKYVDVCGERDGVEFAKRRRTRCSASWRRSDKEIGPAPRHPEGRWGLWTISALVVVEDDQASSSSSCLYLASQAPSANINVFTGHYTSQPGYNMRVANVSQTLRRIPSVSQVLLQEPVRALLEQYPRKLVVEEIQNLLEQFRTAILQKKSSDENLEKELQQLDQCLHRQLEQRLLPSLRRVVNASGVLIHTNIGRAPISETAKRAVAEAAGSYSNLEFDLAEGERGHRDQHFEARMVRLLGCEAATVCNNNAAAVFLVLNTFAQGKKVLVSRGELIEIGGSFRLPAILERSGARLTEVGTTNKTRIADYEDGIDEETALILRVHPSNFKMVGFAQRPELADLVHLACQRRLILIKDAGSGYLFSTPHPSLRSEPTVQSALRQGVDLVCFSGDKLMGGPQAGIIVGKGELVEAVRKNPLMRACRVDKCTYAALDHTLIEYEKGTYTSTLPVYRMLSARIEDLRLRAQNLHDQLDPAFYEGEITDGFSLIGGGAAPEEPIPTCLLAIRSQQLSAQALERKLRAHAEPIIARIEGDRLLLDFRTVFPEEDEILLSALATQAIPKPGL